MTEPSTDPRDRRWPPHPELCRRARAFAERTGLPIAESFLDPAPLVVRGLTLWQPWATGIAKKLKGPETRSWSTSYRGLLLITAAKRPVDSAAWDPPLYRPEIGNPATLPRGEAVALAELVDVVRTEDARVTETERGWGDYAPGRFAWLLENVVELEPFAVRGGQGLWTVGDDVLRIVEEALSC